ncbi:glycosyltransferase family 4 protein [Patescibacteria group bacterium]|nr:glycosyltransferase family 4 protein [Patescibacteria group bacterium]
MAIKTIGIDIRDLNRDGAGKSRYSKEIIKAMISMAPPTVRFILFAKKPCPTYEHQTNVEQVLIPGRSLLWHLNLKKYLHCHPVDFYLSPSSFIYPSLAPKTQPLAIVIHDMIAFLDKKNHYWFPTLVENLTLRRAIRRASFLITISQNTWRDIIKFAPQAKDKPVTFASPAVSEEFKPTIARTLDLPEKFLLGIGTLSPRKNFESVLKAFAHLAPVHPELHLVIAGGKGWKDSRIYKSVPPEHKDRIHFLGYVQHQRLPELYSRAQMLLFPSLYEGFGIPPLEAMACGCPVITGNISSLPEVVGDAAMMINPTSITALTEATEKMLDPKTRLKYIDLGFQRVRSFSWERSAEAILEKILELI